MPSSISNFSRSLPGRSLLVCLAALAAYQALVSTHIVKPSDGLNAAESNKIRAQRYLYRKSGQDDLILVGSSIAENIRPQYIGTHVTNLGQPGSCSQTGLALLQHGPVHARVVLIEIDDTIEHKRDNQFIAGLYQEPLSSLCRWVPIARQEYQPVSVLVEAVKQWKKRHGPSEEERDKEATLDQGLRAQLIGETLAEQRAGISPDEERLLRDEAGSIKSMISQLEGRSVRVVLFRPPRETSIDSSPRQRQIDALLHAEFPATRFEWLPNPPPRQWTTNDGMHLTRSDVKVFAGYIRSYFKLSD